MSEQRAVVESEHVEWGVRWPDGSITSCGWSDGPSEAWARRSLLPTERLVHPTQQVGVAVVRRIRTVFADTVTDWRDDENAIAPIPRDARVAAEPQRAKEKS